MGVRCVLWLSVVAGFWAAGARGSDFPWLGPTATRTVIPLMGKWDVVKGGSLEVDAVSVPFAILGQTRLVLEKEFSVDSAAAEGQLLLVCYGAQRQARIWLNGNFLGTHGAGYAGFVQPIDPGFVQRGSLNRFRVEIDGILRPDAGLPLLHRPGAWREITGLFREIYLLTLPAVAVEDVGVTTLLGAGDALELKLEVELVRRSLQVQGGGLVRAEILDPQTSGLLARSPDVPVDFGNLLRCQVRYTWSVRGIRTWSPQTPILYDLRVSYLDPNFNVVDVWQARTGFRSLAVTREGLLLNGRPVRVQGVEWVEALPAGVYLGQVATQLAEMKAAGCNLVRIVGRPPHPLLAEVADSLGMLILEEIPLWKVPDRLLASSSLAESAMEYIVRTVRRDRVHPCIAAWGLGVGLQGQERQAALALRRIREVVERLDDRPCYAVIEGGRAAASFPVDLVLSDWTGVPPSQLGEWKGSPSAWLPIVGYLPDPPDGPEGTQDRREENRAYLLWAAATRFSNHPTGMIVRSWSDWRAAAPCLPLGVPFSDRIGFGILGEGGEKRISFYVLRALYAGDARPTIRFEASARRQLDVFLLTGLGLGALFVWHFRRDRRFRGNLRRVFLYPSSIYEDVRARRKISGYHTFLQGFFASAGLALVISSMLTFFRDSWRADEILELFAGTGMAKALLIWLAWHPLAAVAMLTLVFLSALTLAGILFWLGAVWRVYMPLGQAFTFVFWISTSFLPAVIWGSVAYRAMEGSAGMVWLSVGLVAGLAFWFVLRLVRGTSVILRIPWWEAVVLLATLMASILVPASILLERKRALFAYVAYYLRSLL
ncbi:MAG: hypothetical protein ONB23_13015 [candidate division KSB1 bacterium]|nr:hypothetical protein [candidate division KSB1 bacterium]